MPTNLKRLVRARMEQTGENYTAALRAVRGEHVNSATRRHDAEYPKYHGQGCEKCPVVHETKDHRP